MVRKYFKSQIWFTVLCIIGLGIPVLYHFYLRDIGFSRVQAGTRSGVAMLVALIIIGSISQFDKSKRG